MSATLGSTDLKRLHRNWRKKTDQRISVILDSVQTPYNVGSILRTAAAYKIESLWCCGSTPDVLESKVQKTAMGSHRFITNITYTDITTACLEAKKEGYAVLVLELTAQAIPLFEFKTDTDICIVVGHEDRGVSKNVLETCDASVYLPQIGSIGSLNVAMATGIALAELRRQEWQR